MYRRIAQQLRGEISSGALAPGTRLPTEQDLMERFTSSRNTVRLALAALANEGLVLSEQGRGSFVRERRPVTYHAAYAEAPDRPASMVDSFHTEARREGRESSQTFVMRIEPAGPEVAARLQVAEDDLVVLRRVVRYVDGQVWSDQDSWYPMDVSQAAGLVTPHDIPQGTIRALADAGFTECGWADEITARMPTPDESRDLGIGSGVPLIVYLRTGHTPERPIRLTRSLFPADRNRIVYELGQLPYRPEGPT